MSYPNTVAFFRKELTASDCLDEETRERVYQCLAKRAVETLGDGTDMHDVEMFLAYGEGGFPFSLRAYDIGSAHYDDDYSATADIVRSLIQVLKKDGVGMNYYTLDEGPSISWTARSDKFSFYINAGEPVYFVNGEDIGLTSCNILDRLDASLAPLAAVELWKRECVQPQN